MIAHYLETQNQNFKIWSVNFFIKLWHHNVHVVRPISCGIIYIFKYVQYLISITENKSYSSFNNFARKIGVSSLYQNMLTANTINVTNKVHAENIAILVCLKALYFFICYYWKFCPIIFWRYLHFRPSCWFCSYNGHRNSGSLSQKAVG